jgi:hypothetical protein
MRTKRNAAWMSMLAVLAAAVPAAAAEQDRAGANCPREFTLGLVQKELRRGLSQTDVAERLGSPNIVTRASDGSEAWVYDKVSSEVEASGSSIGLGGLGSGTGASFGGILGITAGRRSEKARSSQRTLTVVVRFSTAGTVESFSWHDSRF